MKKFSVANWELEGARTSPFVHYKREFQRKKGRLYCDFGYGTVRRIARRYRGEGGERRVIQKWVTRI